MLPGFRNSLKHSHHNQSIYGQLLKFGVILAIIIFTHILAMMTLEKMSLIDSLWLTITSITTVGYGDLYAQTIYGRIATILLIYIGGIATLAQTAVLYFEYRHNVRSSKLKGNWRWKMKNHIVFLNSPKKNGEEYFFRAISEIRNSNSKLAKAPIIIISSIFEDGISNRLRKLNVNHVKRDVTNLESLEDASIKSAQTVVILTPDQDDSSADCIHFDLIDRIKELNQDAHIVSEVVKDENRSRLKRVGASNVIRPIRSYPELLSRVIITPGSEQILESLFNNFGVQCIRYDITLNTKWISVIQNCAQNDIGLPIAYENENNQIITSPQASEEVLIKAIFIISSEGKVQNINRIKEILLEASSVAWK